MTNYLFYFSISACRSRYARAFSNNLFSGYSCLYRAAQYAHSEVVELLLRHGADVNMAGRYVD